MEDRIIIRKLPPAWFIKALTAFRNGLLRLNRRLFPANVVLYEHFQYFWLLPCVRVAAELDIAGLLSRKALTLAELAQETDCHPDSLNRLMRALSSSGIFRLRKDGRFVNTPMSKALIDGKGSLRWMVMHHLGRVNWNLFSELSHKIKTGEEVFSKVYGKHIYDYLVDDKRESMLFDRSMTDLSEMAVEPTLSAYNFAAYPMIADIGGGEGLLLSSILYKYPEAHGILFDLPEGVAHAEKILGKYGVASRVKVVSGSFFEKPPAGADLYILKNILHNWSDDDCRRILSGIREVMQENSRLLVIEMIIEEDNRPSFGKLIDIQMMVIMRDGRERTRREFDRLFDSAGLKIARIVPTIAPFSLIEITRA